VLYFFSYKGLPFVDKSLPTVKIDDVIRRDINAKYYDSYVSIQE